VLVEFHELHQTKCCNCVDSVTFFMEDDEGPEWLCHQCAREDG
jgi:hypothetical protein